MKLLEISQGTAEVITDSVVNYLCHTSPAPLHLMKLAGGSTDGASVMSGIHGGVVAHLKQLIPQFLATRCVAHRLSLAAS